MSMAKQCKATTKRETRCPNAASASGYCFTHDPDRVAERSAARRLGGLRRHPARVSGDAPVRVETVVDVLCLVNAVIADAWVLENTPARARALLAAGDAAIRALQIGELAERVAALEERLTRGDTHEAG